jgi:hypothetical protein
MRSCLCLVSVLVSADVFLVLLPLFVLILLVFASVVIRLVSDERLSVFWAWRGFCQRLYIRDVYVRSYSSPRSNSLHSTILKDIAFDTRLLFALDTVTKYLSLLLDTSLVSISTRSLHFAASYPAEPYICFLAMSQEFDSQMQQAPPAAPASNPVADTWHHLADLVAITIHPAPSFRPVIPANTPPEFAASIHRAYRCGGQAFHQPNLDIEPEIPDNAGTLKCGVALWEFFWQGHRYSEKVATTKACSLDAVSDTAVLGLIFRERS